MKQHHLDRCIQRAPVDRTEGRDPEELALKEWVVCTKCCAHAAYNALKWSMTTQFPGTSQLLDSLWAILAAMRHSASQLHEHLGSWIGNHVHFEQPALLPKPAEAVAFFGGGHWASLPT